VQPGCPLFGWQSGEMRVSELLQLLGMQPLFLSLMAAYCGNTSSQLHLRYSRYICNRI